MPTLNVSDREPIAWMARYILICELAKPELGSESERQAGRYRAQMKRLGPDNSVLGSVQLPKNVAVESAHLIPEEDWETGTH